MVATPMGHDADVQRAMAPGDVEPCLAFGAACLAVIETRHGLARAGVASGPAADSFEDLVAAHEDLRQLFADGVVDGIPERALSVMVLAERTTSLLP